MKSISFPVTVNTLHFNVLLPFNYLLKSVEIATSTAGCRTGRGLLRERLYFPGPGYWCKPCQNCRGDLSRVCRWQHKAFNDAAERETLKFSFAVHSRRPSLDVQNRPILYMCKQRKSKLGFDEEGCIMMHIMHLATGGGRH